MSILRSLVGLLAAALVPTLARTQESGAPVRRVISIVNTTESMNGLQLGGINIIRDESRGRRASPVLTWGK